jgi:hypothetical protein
MATRTRKEPDLISLALLLNMDTRKKQQIRTHHQRVKGSDLCYLFLSA